MNEAEEVCKWMGDLICTAKDGDAWCAVRDQPGAKEWAEKLNRVWKALQKPKESFTAADAHHGLTGE